VTRRERNGRGSNRWGSAPRETTRRAFLARVGAAAGTALGAALAGCGYRPGGGDIRWRDERAGHAVADADTAGVAGETVYALDHDTRFINFDREADHSEMFTRGSVVDAFGTDRGRPLWDETHEAGMACSAVGPNGAAAATGAQVHRYTGEGQAWTASVPGEVRAVAPAGDRVYALAAGTLYATAGGTTRWSADTDPVSDPESMDVAASGSVAVCGDAGGVVGFAPDGRRRWRRTDLRARGVTVADPGVLVVATGGLAVLDPGTGGTRWRYDEHGIRGPPAVGPEGVYVETLGGVLALDPEGTERWSVSLSPRERRPVVADERGVFVAEEFDLDAGEPLLRLDRTDGTTRWSVTYERITAGPFLAPSGVLVAAEGDLVCHVP